MGYDPSGHLAFFVLTAIIGAVIGGTAAGATAYNDGARDWELVGWTALGALGGCAIGAAVGAGTAMLLTGNATATITATYHGLKSLAWAYTLGGTGGALSFIGNNLGIGTGYYPGQDGFAYMTSMTLQPGEYIQRIGHEGGSFVAPYFTDPFSLSIPYNQIPNMYNPNVYQVLKPYTVTAGTAVPWFGQYGGGMQYKLGISIAELVAQDVLKAL